MTPAHSLRNNRNVEREVNTLPQLWEKFSPEDLKLILTFFYKTREFKLLKELICQPTGEYLTRKKLYNRTGVDRKTQLDIFSDWNKWKTMEDAKSSTWTSYRLSMSEKNSHIWKILSQLLFLLEQEKSSHK